MKIMNVSTSYLYLLRTILQNKLQILEMQTHQNKNWLQRYFMFIH